MSSHSALSKSKPVVITIDTSYDFKKWIAGMLMLKLKDSIFCWMLIFAAQPLGALTTLNVTLNSDNNPGGIGEIGDLRYCLNTMNQGLNTTPDDYAIVFDTPMTIQLNGILPVINNSINPVNITIGNPGSIPTVTIDGNSGAYSGFFIPTGNVTIQNINFQNLTAKGGNGGNGISGGGGGLGAGGAIYVPQTFLNGSFPSVTLMNVSINTTSAVGGNGGSYLGLSSTGNEGGGGGGGFSGNGGSVTTTGSTGGAGGGGFGGDGGNVTLSTDELIGGGGGGGGGFGSRATLGTLTNLGNGGSDQNAGQNGNGYGLSITAGSGGGGNTGGINAGGGGGGAAGVSLQSGGGGGGSAGTNGTQPQGNIPPIRKHLAQPSGGNGGDGAGAGGGGVVLTSSSNEIDGQSGSGGYCGGGGGGAGTGAGDTDYTVKGGAGGVGGGGGGGGVNIIGITSAEGGNSLGGGGGGGGGPSNGSGAASGGSDTGNLGGGAGGAGANTVGPGFGGGGGGGGSGLGGAIFVDSNLNFTIQAITGIPTIFNTLNTTTQAGTHGSGGPEGSDGLDGSALGNSIFLRAGASLTLSAQGANDILTLGDQVAFTDDTSFGAGGTNVTVQGNGTVVYNGTADYQGTVQINNANFRVNGQISQAPIFVCRNAGFSPQRGTLSGVGTLSGSVFANSGTISPDINSTLNLGSLTLNPPANGSLGSLVHININSGGTSVVAVNGPASLAGGLEINLDASAKPGKYIILTSTGITGSFSAVTFNGLAKGRKAVAPNYTLSYLPAGAPTFVQFELLNSSVDIPATVNGSPIINPAVVCCGRPVILGPLPVPGSGPTVYSVSKQVGNVQCKIGQTKTQTYLKMHGSNGSCTIIGRKDGIVSNPLTVIAP